MLYTHSLPAFILQISMILLTINFSLAVLVWHLMVDGPVISLISGNFHNFCQIEFSSITPSSAPFYLDHIHRVAARP